MHRVASRQRLFSWDHFDARSSSANNDVDVDVDVDVNIDVDSERTISPSPSPTRIDIFSGTSKTNDSPVPAPKRTIMIPDNIIQANDSDNDNDNDGDDLSDYSTCVSMMSRHNSLHSMAMLLHTRSSSFGMNNNEDDDNDNDNDPQAVWNHYNIVSDDDQDEDNNDYDNDHDNDHDEDDDHYFTKAGHNTSTSTNDVTDYKKMSILMPMTMSTTTTMPMPMPTTISSFSLLHLNQDVHLSILSFLDLNSLRSITLSCRYFWMLLTNSSESVTTSSSSSSARNAIWWNVMKNMWPFLSLAEYDGCDYYDDDVTTAGTITPRTHNKHQKKKKYLPNMINFVTNESNHNNNNSSISISISNNNIIPSTTHTKHNQQKELQQKQQQLLLPLQQNNKNHPKHMNYGVLLTQVATQLPPTCIDSSFFEPVTVHRIRIFVNNADGILHRERLRSNAKRQIFVKYNIVMNNNNNNNAHHDCDLNWCDGGSSCCCCQLEVVQYIGKVGVGDRSIRSNRPLPRPLESLPMFIPEKTKCDKVTQRDEMTFSISGSTDTGTTWSSRRSNAITKGRKRPLSDSNSSSNSTGSNTMTTMSMNLFDRLRSCNRHNSSVGAVLLHGKRNKTTNHGKLPFVSPIVVAASSSSSFKRYLEIDLTPKLMTYFEVTILSKDEALEQSQVNGNNNRSILYNDDDDDVLFNDDNNGLDNHERVEEEVVTETTSSCIAIGLSTKEYSSSIRMPGWDVHSYGYHGDDGGIFHSSGDMIRVYGPKYGEGDCVGCGVNYANGGMFFTLNGDFLGYAWCNEEVVLDGKVDLYPTIGVDSSNLLACNFGNERPFTFDLSKFVATQGSLL